MQGSTDSTESTLIPNLALSMLRLLGPYPFYLYGYLVREAPSFDVWFEVSQNTLTRGACLSPATVRKCLAKIEDAGLAIVDTATNQHAATKVKLLGGARSFGDVPPQDAETENPQLDDGARSFGDSAPKPLGFSMSLDLGLDLGGSAEGGNGKKSGRAKKEIVEHPRFAEFWGVVPRRVSRQTAVKAFNAAAEKVDVDVIIAKVAEYTGWCAATDTTPAYPASWLNACRWTDDYELPASAKPFAASRPNHFDDV